LWKGNGQEISKGKLDFVPIFAGTRFSRLVGHVKCNNSSCSADSAVWDLAIITTRLTHSAWLDFTHKSVAPEDLPLGCFCGSIFEASLGLVTPSHTCKGDGKLNLSLPHDSPCLSGLSLLTTRPYYSWFRWALSIRSPRCSYALSFASHHLL
jgi:hypothetical protein